MDQRHVLRGVRRPLNSRMIDGRWAVCQRSGAVVYFDAKVADAMVDATVVLSSFLKRTCSRYRDNDTTRSLAKSAA